jgi:hypothetical protein
MYGMHNCWLNKIHTQFRASHLASVSVTSSLSIPPRHTYFINLATRITEGADAPSSCGALGFRFPVYGPARPVGCSPRPIGCLDALLIQARSVQTLAPSLHLQKRISPSFLRVQALASARELEKLGACVQAGERGNPRVTPPPPFAPFPLV